MRGKEPEKPEYKTFKYLAGGFALALFLGIVLWPVAKEWPFYPMVALGLALLLILFLAASLRTRRR